LLQYFTQRRKPVTETSTLAVHNTFVIERSYPHSPERIFAALSQPSHKRQWYAEGDHDIEQFEMDFRVGGTERFGYRFRPGHPIAGSQIVNHGTYQEIVPDSRIVMTAKMSLNGKTMMVQLATVELMPTQAGTDLILTHQGTFLDWEGGPQMIEGGWRALLERLQTYLAQ
jgi:uncharacterized protein YndB with AHSA1/START domain